MAPQATMFVASFCVMVIEIVAGRIVSKYLGQSIYSWTSVIGVVLAGISVGNWLGGQLADRFRPYPTTAALFGVSSLCCLCIPTVNQWAGGRLFLLDLDWPIRILIHVALTFLPPAFVLGAISPVVAKVALQSGSPIGKTLGSLYAWAAVGSVAGTFAAGFYLIGRLETFSIVALVAIILAVVALLYAVRWRFPWVCLLLAVVGLWSSAGSSEAAREAGQAFRFRDLGFSDVIQFYGKESQYACISVWASKHQPDSHIMSLDRLRHSVVNIKKPLKLMAQYTWVMDVIIGKFTGEERPASVLIIGGGGYVLPQYLELSRPGSHIYVAEIDSYVTEAAFLACGLRTNTTISIIHKDARNAVDDIVRTGGKDGPEIVFDYVIGDSINDCAIPYHLTTQEFNDSISHILKSDGMYLLHVIDIYDSPKFLGAILNTVRRTFEHVYVVSATNVKQKKSGYVVVCSKTERDMSDISALIGKRYPFYAGELLSKEQEEYVRDSSRGIVLTDDYAPVDQIVTYLVRGGRQELVEKYIRLSRQWAEQGQYGQASRYIRKALEVDPEYVKAYRDLALDLEKQERHDAAIRELDRALEIDPHFLDAQILRGEIIAGRGDFQAAIREWKAVLEKDPSQVEARNSLALALEALGRTDEAMSHWAEVVRHDPDNSTAYYYLGISYLKKGDTAKALWHTRKASEVDPGLSRLKTPYATGTNAAAKVIEQMSL